MTRRSSFIFSFFAAAVFLVGLPTIASAQWGGNNNGRWGRRDDDRNGYNRSALKETIKRVHDRSNSFKDRLEDALDRSRLNGSDLEDRLNHMADRFHDAAHDLKDNFDNGRNLNRSTDEARRLLQVGSELDRFMSRARLDGRAESDWAQIRNGLRTIANAYGFNYGDFDDDRYDDDDYNNGRGNGNGRGGRRWPY